jgi:hypothetical protein
MLSPLISHLGVAFRRLAFHLFSCPPWLLLVFFVWHRVRELWQEVNTAGLVSPASTCLDFAAKQSPPGLPSHKLTIKANTIYCLLQIFSLNHGLVINVCVIVTDLGNQLIAICLIRNWGGEPDTYREQLFIPRISLSHTLQSPVRSYSLMTSVSIRTGIHNYIQ